MSIKSNFEKALLRFAYIIISRNSQELSGKYPKLVCFSFDYIGNYINVYGRYEKSLLNKLREIIIQQGNSYTVLDIGANIGNHAVFFSEFFEEVIAFEPNPKTYSVLKINTELLVNVTCMMIGASSRNATLNFSINELNMGDSRIISDKTEINNEADSNITIDVSPIDAIEEIKDKNIGLIKIDVQGHEVDVIRGMLNTLRKNTPMIVFEQEATEVVGGSSDTVKELKNIGYNYFYAIESRRSILSSSIPSFIRIPLELLEIVVRGDGSDAAECYEINSLEKRQYNMLIASIVPIELSASA